MAGAGGPKPGSANMEFKEMKEESTTPPTVEYEHIKACIVFCRVSFNFNVFLLQYFFVLVVFTPSMVVFTPSILGYIYIKGIYLH